MNLFVEKEVTLMRPQKLDFYLIIYFAKYKLVVFRFQWK